MTEKLEESYCFTHLNRPVKFVDNEKLDFRQRFSKHQLNEFPDLLVKDELFLFLVFKQTEEGEPTILGISDPVKNINQIDIDKAVCQYTNIPLPHGVPNLEKTLFEMLGHYLGEFIKNGDEASANLILGILRTLYPDRKALVAYIGLLDDSDKIRVTDIWEILPTNH